MKKCFLLLLILISCNKIKRENPKIATKTIVEKKQLHKFYDSDEIDHYYLNISEKAALDILKIDHKTSDELILSKLLCSYYPNSISEINLEDKLKKFKFVKTVLDKTKKTQVENIFSEKDSIQSDFSGCIPYYRDIFIFKKNDSIIGISKVCFGCGVSQFIGSKINTDGFGLRSELEKLEIILRKK